MRYAYSDLGQQTAGNVVTARLHGSAANVVLLDPTNFHHYRRAEPFNYTGGLYLESPAELTIPRNGHWYAAVDLGGYAGHVRAEIEVTHAARPEERSRRTLLVTGAGRTRRPGTTRPVARFHDGRTATPRPRARLG